ncbi:MAG TPA: hypothetical protein VGJ38_03285, partial [Jatrophihabitantaceae bacterium]
TTTAENTDLTGVFMNYRPDKDGKPVLTANLQIASLDKTLPPPSDSQGGLWYYVVYNVDGTVWFVRAALPPSGGDPEYAYGTIDATGVYTTVGTTTGAFFEGADGVVQIDVPAEAGGTPGTLLGGVVGTVDYIQGVDDVVGLNNHVDTAPDQADVIDPNGESYTVADCPVAVTASTSPSSTPRPTALPFRASPTIGSARTARKGRTLRVRVQATRAITDLRVQLRAASGRGAVLASGAARSLSGAGTLRLKLARTLKKGRYALVATGTVDGRRLRAVQRVRVGA